MDLPQKSVGRKDDAGASRPPLSRISSLRLYALGGTSDHAASKWEALFRWPLLWYRTSLGPILLREIRSLGYRISVELKIRQEVSRGDPLVPDSLQPLLVQGSESYRRAYIQDMKRLEADQPLLSTSDRILATRMWLAGSCNSACSCRSAPCQNK